MDDYLAWESSMSELFARGTRFGILIALTDSGMPDTAAVKRAPQFIDTNHAAFQELIVAAAFSLPSPVLRGAFRFVTGIRPMPMPHRVVDSPEQGREWIEGALRAEGISYPETA